MTKQFDLELNAGTSAMIAGIAEQTALSESEIVDRICAGFFSQKSAVKAVSGEFDAAPEFVDGVPTGGTGQEMFRFFLAHYTRSFTELSHGQDAKRALEEILAPVADRVLVLVKGYAMSLQQVLCEAVNFMPTKDKYLELAARAENHRLHCEVLEGLLPSAVGIVKEAEDLRAEAGIGPIIRMQTGGN